MGYIYKQTERGEYPLWTVGTYDSGEWETDSDHSKEEEAAERARYLNGGNVLTPVQKMSQEILETLIKLHAFTKGVTAKGELAETFRPFLQEAEAVIKKARSAREDKKAKMNEMAA